jgi:putative phosphoserine phosphatase/1-acylglycerol-3-phosphate O-acyltransferase
VDRGWSAWNGLTTAAQLNAAATSERRSLNTSKTDGSDDHNRYLADLAGAEEGAGIGALFDFDGTIIAGFSAFALLREKFARRQMTAGESLETLDAMVRYAIGNIGFPGLMSLAAKYMRGVRVDSFLQFSEELYVKRIAPRIYPETRALIRAHQAKRHTVAIVSSATIYQVGPAARDLDIEHVLCSRYEMVKDRFTGKYVRPLCFGRDKVATVEALARSAKLDLDRSYFYSDSHDDIELLQRVGRPRPLNPNDRLRKIAKQRGWPIETYSSRGRPGLFDYVRSLTPVPTLLGSAVAALPLLALTRSAREATNFIMGTFGDYGSAIAGIDMQVRGEKNLWTARPCVFVFNHQSQADVLIIAKLLRRDISSIGKRELRDVPLVGKLLELCGMVFVDRRNTPDAVKAMAPLVDAIKRDGKSVCIAPEGSRTSTPKLAAFKKGAFHLAMQAGVPIVPVVIHNSGDLQPKNEFVLRPGTVRIDVLPPVDTSKWRPRTIARHVHDVRALFLQTLGQPAEPRRRRPDVTNHRSRLTPKSSVGHRAATTPAR